MAQPSPCSLSGDALMRRIGDWESLASAWLGSEPSSTGAVVHYKLDAAVAQALLELIEAEGQCCPSVSFKATVTLRVDAAKELRPWVVSTFVHQAPERVTTVGHAERAVDRESVAEAVRAHYANVAGSVAAGHPGARGEGESVRLGAGVYDASAVAALPERVVASSIGCANPVAVAELRPGDIVLDLGSGGGLDVLLTARRVGPTGKAYGLDMTDEMVEVARQNQIEAGIHNAEFLQGRIEAIPLPDDRLDVVLSNCVIGLSPDKNAVFAETYRVLRPGGRLAFADVVADTEATAEQVSVVENWVGCLAGSLTRSQYRSLLQGAGFVDVDINDSHALADGFDSVIVRATKPGLGEEEARRPL